MEGGREGKQTAEDGWAVGLTDKRACKEKVSEEEEEAKRGEATKYLSFLLLRSEERASEAVAGRTMAS